MKTEKVLLTICNEELSHKLEKLENENAILNVVLLTSKCNIELEYELLKHDITPTLEFNNQFYRIKLLLLDDTISKFDRKSLINLYDYTLVINEKNINELKKIIILLYELLDKSGILSDDVLRLMTKFGMIFEDYDENNIQGCSYDIRLGSQYYKEKKVKELTKMSNILTVDPYDYVIVLSHEHICLPKNITMTFDLKVQLFCQGIILSNGPCVDPGFRGKLLCLLFNISNQSVNIKWKNHYITAVVSKTIRSCTPYEGKYQDKQDVSDYLPTMSLVGAIKHLQDEVVRLKNETKNMQALFFALLSFFLAVVTLIIALK